MEHAMPARAEMGLAGDSSDGEEFLLASDSEHEPRQTKSWRLYAAGGALGVACLLGVVALVALPGTQPVRPAAPLTVRALLEGRELTEMATDNVLAMGGDELAALGRDQVRAHVAQGLQNISQTIRNRYPEAHEQLSKLQLSGAQKDAAFHVLRKYGDARMVGLTHDVAEAVRASSMEGRSREETQRRLAERLRSRLAEMRQLSEEMFPGSSQQLSIDMDRVPELNSWHAQLQVDLGHATGRRLATAGALGGVRAQAQTLFRSLEGQLGDDMPKAPARMLMSFGDSSSGSSSSSSGSDSEASFMTCVMKAVPNPMDCAQCIADNMQEVMHMMMGFMGGKTL